MLECTLAGLAIDVDPAIVTLIPFSNPWRWDLRRTVVGLGWICLLALAVGLLRRVPLTLALTLIVALAGVGVLVDEVVEERHVAAVLRNVCGYFEMGCSLVTSH